MSISQDPTGAALLIGTFDPKAPDLGRQLDDFADQVARLQRARKVPALIFATRKTKTHTVIRAFPARAAPRAQARGVSKGWGTPKR